MIIENRYTRKKRTMSLYEFKKEFAKDIQAAFDSYCKTQNNKPYFALIKCQAIYESEFECDFQWNFNNFGNAAWYIKSL